MIKYKLKEVKPRIFLVTFTDHYDMCMTFLRYQECYESPNPKFRNKQFTIIDFMEWYSKKQSNGYFEYPKHWSGFNVPSSIFSKVLGGVDEQDLATVVPWRDFIDDYNKYDYIMERIQEECSSICEAKHGTSSFYLIGAMQGSEDTVKHEVAHGFFALNKNYRQEMKTLIKKLKPSFRNKLYKSLLEIGYTKQVLEDETQAFLATGWREFFPKLNTEDKPFIEVFNKYNEV